jgi:hypothetical protein
MIFSVPTNYEEFTLLVRVKTDRPEKIRVIFKDRTLPNTIFTNRWKTINGETDFYIRVPVSGKDGLLLVYNDRIGNVPKDSDRTFEVVEVKKIPLEKKLDVVDLGNPVISAFVEFCTKFCFNAGHLTSGTYLSKPFTYTNKDGKVENSEFRIEYLPTIISQKGVELNTPARISKSSGRIQVSQKKIIPMTIPMRMAIMLHEFSHYYINDDIENESEADMNGLIIYLGLGYPRIEAYEAFTKTFIGTPTETNKRRYDRINHFIENFEKNNMIVYE